jgi:hypothetical protein
MSRTRSELTPASPRRGRLLRAFRIGPGLLLAILAAIVIGIQERPNLQAPRVRPVVEHVPHFSQRPSAAPDLSLLLARADALQLTPRQRTAIVRLMKQWAPESAQRRRDMDRAAAGFTQFMQEAQHRGQGVLGDIQRHAAETSALTTQWLARKAYFWQQGLTVLTSEQRQRLRQIALGPGVVRSLETRRDR